MRKSLIAVILGITLLSITGCDKEVSSIQVENDEVAVSDVDDKAIDKKIKVDDTIKIDKDNMQTINDSILNISDIIENNDLIKQKFSKVNKNTKTSYEILDESLSEFIRVDNIEYRTHSLNSSEQQIVLKEATRGGIVQSITVDAVYDSLDARSENIEILDDILKSIQISDDLQFKESNTLTYETDASELVTVACTDLNKGNTGTLTSTISINNNLECETMQYDEIVGLVDNYKTDIGTGLTHIEENIKTMFSDFGAVINVDDIDDDSIDKVVLDDLGDIESDYNFRVVQVQLEDDKVNSMKCIMDYYGSNIVCDIQHGKMILDYQSTRDTLDGMELLDKVIDVIDNEKTDIFQSTDNFTAETSEHTYLAVLENYGSNSQNHQIRFNISITTK